MSDSSIPVANLSTYSGRNTRSRQAGPSTKSPLQLRVTPSGSSRALMTQTRGRPASRQHPNNLSTARLPNGGHDACLSLIAALLSQNTGLRQDIATLQGQVGEHLGISGNPLRENHPTAQSSQPNPVHDARRALATAMRQARGTAPIPRETDVQLQQDFITPGVPQAEEADYTGPWDEEIANIDDPLFVDSYGF